MWIRPVRDEDAMDFKVQRYRGEFVLTWWQDTHSGYGKGEYPILDTSYREMVRKGFETALDFATAEPYVAARAKDLSGQTLGTKEAVKRKS